MDKDFEIIILNLYWLKGFTTGSGSHIPEVKIDQCLKAIDRLRSPKPYEAFIEPSLTEDETPF